jgi:hypothetical protein
MNAYYKIVGLTVGSFVIGYLLWPMFFELSVAQVKTPGMIMNTSGNNDFYDGTLFWLTIGLIPFLHFAVNKSTKSISIKHNVISLFVIVFCGIISWQARLLLIASKAERMNLGVDQAIMFEHPINQLQPQLYFSIGIMVGTIISWLTLRVTNGNTVK